MLHCGLQQAAQTPSFITWGNFSSLKPTEGVRTCLGEVLQKQFPTGACSGISCQNNEDHSQTSAKAFCRLPATWLLQGLVPQQHNYRVQPLLHQDTDWAFPSISFKVLHVFATAWKQTCYTSPAVRWEPPPTFEVKQRKKLWNPVPTNPPENCLSEAPASMSFSCAHTCRDWRCFQLPDSFIFIFLVLI